MRIKKFICCPRCKKDLLACTGYCGAGSGTGSTPYYMCPGCGLKYPVVDGVVDFLPGNNREKTLAQRLMESEPIVAIYESRWWRASKLFALFTKISLDNEISLIKSVVDFGPTDVVLDLACGSGIYTRDFAGEIPKGEVIGLDLSWPMLRYAAGKAERSGIENVTFIHGDAHCLPFNDASIDVANCGGAMHLFPDVRGVLMELRRVIKPDGRLAMAVFLRRGHNLCSILDAHFDEKVIGIHPFREEEIRKLLDEAGFEPAIYHARGVWMIAGGIRRT